MTLNPHFRVLALTATPGAKADAVQNVVDSLHVSLFGETALSLQIGHIEVVVELSPSPNMSNTESRIRVSIISHRYVEEVSGLIVISRRRQSTS